MRKTQIRKAQTNQNKLIPGMAQTDVTEKVVHLSPQEFAERLGVGPNTPAQWRMQGKGPKFIKAGRYISYRLVDIIDWENQRVFSSNAEVRD